MSQHLHYENLERYDGGWAWHVTRRASPHALKRMRDRRVSAESVDAALRWGFPIRQKDGRCVYFLGRRHVEKAAVQGEHLAETTGLAVVVGRDDGVITVIRTPRPNRLKRHERRARTVRRHSWSVGR